MIIKKLWNMMACALVILLLITVSACQNPEVSSSESDSKRTNVENKEDSDSKKDVQEVSTSDKLAKYKKLNMTLEEAFETLYTKVETTHPGLLEPLFKRYIEEVEIPTTPKGSKDGVYTVESPYDNMGFKHVITLEIKDEKIVSVKYDEIYQEEYGKESHEEYNKAMKADTGSCPKEAYPIYRNKLIETQDLLSIDSVSGATFSLYRFNAVASKALYESRK